MLPVLLKGMVSLLENGSKVVEVIGDKYFNILVTVRLR